MILRPNRRRPRTHKGAALALLLALLLVMSSWAGAEKLDSEAAEQGREKTTLMFVSDYQHKDGWKDPPETLSALLDALEKADVHPDNAVICGDYSTFHGKNNHNGNPKSAIGKIKHIFIAHNKDWKAEQMIFVQGNHDKKTKDISAPGLHEFDEYLVYVLNDETEYPSAQGPKKRKGIVQAGAKRLEKCLKKLVKRGESRPVFLAAHVPLHFTGRTARRGDNIYAEILFKVISKYGTKLNLVYLYGHNHDDGWDSYMGGSCCFRAPGDSLLIPKVKGKKKRTKSYVKRMLNFTYLNAGYTGYFAKGSGESALTCTVCTIEEKTLTFQRYVENGPHLLSGKGTPNKAVNDKKLIPKQYYGRKRTGSFRLKRRKIRQRAGSVE